MKLWRGEPALLVAWCRLRRQCLPEFSFDIFQSVSLEIPLASDTVLVSYVVDLSVEFLVMMLFIPSRILAASFLSTPKLSTNALTNSKMVCVS